MNIQETAIYILGQTESILSQIKKKDYVKVIPIHKASVGQHTRHMIEFYQCLFEGIEPGIVNYDQRKRDHAIETNPEIALERIREISQKIRHSEYDKYIILELNYDVLKLQNNQVKSSFTRELVYNIEHSIHHMAIIKTMLIDFFNYINLPENYGIAPSTIRYRKGALN